MYCSAELQRFNEMQKNGEFAKYDISVVALSKDTPEEVMIHRERDNLSVKLLSDAKLKVIRQYGVEHHKSYGFETGSFKILGVPVRFKGSFKSMAIPTTLLIDEEGIIRWIDQAEDYRIRSDNARLLPTIESVFG